MNNFDYKYMTPFKWFVLENFPFIENDFEAINNYRLFSKVVEYLNKMKDNVNLTGQQMENLTNAMIELQNYVNNYFENLDVQEEINNKLDEMVEAGTLQEIIADYLNSKAIFGFDTVNDMKQATNLINGSYAKTLGFYSKNDGGMATYKIRTITNDDVVDEMFIIALNDENLIAELVYNSNINVLCLGAKNDGLFDNKSIIDNAITKLNEGGLLYFPQGEYLTSGNHIVDTNGEIEIKGSGKNTTKIILSDNGNYIFWCKNENNHLLVPVEFSDFSIYEENTNNNRNAFILSDRWGYKLKNILAYFSGTFCQFYNNIAWTEGAIIENCDLRGCLNGFTCDRNINSETATDSFYNIKIDKCSHDMNQPYSKFINLTSLENNNYPINAYQWEVNATIWFGSTGGGKTIIRVGNYNYLSGKINIYQDGTAGIYDGSDFNTILVNDNGMFDAEGSIHFLQKNENIINQYKISQFLKQVTNWKFTNYAQPLAHLKGLKITTGNIISQGTEAQIIYTSGYLLPFSSYRVKISEEGAGGVRTTEQIITTQNINVNIGKNIISGTNERRLSLRPINNGTPGGYQENNGLHFEIYLTETLSSNLKYNIEIEML